MKKIICIIAILCMTYNCEALQLTDQQFENLSIINDVIKAKYPQFKGFNGSSKDMKVRGISETAISEELSKINIDEIKAEQYDAYKEEEVIQERMRKLAIDSLKKEGKTFKYVEK